MGQGPKTKGHSVIDFSQLKDLSPPVLIWAALNFLMFAAKRVPAIPNWSIPFISFALGGIAYPLLSDPGKVSFAVRCPICAQVLTGLLVGGAAVGTHQAFKKFIERFGVSLDEDAPLPISTTKEATEPKINP